MWHFVAWYKFTTASEEHNASTLKDEPSNQQAFCLPPYNTSVSFYQTLWDHQEAGVVAMFYCCIWEVLGSKLGWDVAHPVWGFCGVPWSLQESAVLYLLPNPFQFIVYQLSYHFKLYSVSYWQCHKINYKRTHGLTTQMIILFNLKCLYTLHFKHDRKHWMLPVSNGKAWYRIKIPFLYHFIFLLTKSESLYYDTDITRRKT
jgi:hypothetical protein